MEQFIKKIAKEAGKIMMEHYGKLQHIEHKGAKDIVTEADKMIEQFVIKKIKEKYPDHSFLGEETGKHGDSENMWVIDPIDGTKNYAIQNPFFNFSIAFAKNWEVTHGAVYYPVQDELFYAEKGKGATLNNKPIHTSKKDKLADSFISFCRGNGENAISRSTKLYSKLAPKVYSLRQIGAAALELCYVACGRIESFYSHDIHSWDMAAGQLIVQEAGGNVTDFYGKPLNIKQKEFDILSTNGKIHKQMLDMLKEP